MRLRRWLAKLRIAEGGQAAARTSEASSAPRTLRIVFLASEVVPFIKTGGLAESACKSNGMVAPSRSGIEVPKWRCDMSTNRETRPR